MLTKKELLEALADIPDDWPVYIEADHGQMPEQASGIAKGFYSEDKPPYYGEDNIWEGQAEEDDEEPDWNCVLIGY